MRRQYLLSILSLSLAVLVAFSAGCSRSQKPGGQATRLQIKGSDTMVNLMSNLAEAYMKAHPNASIAVTGGGSGTGIAALLNGTTDICAASRSLKPEEDQAARAKGIQPASVVVGLDGISVMVNKANSASELSIEQLRRIYSGDYSNWKDLGGPDRKIVVLSRESNSGTYAYFQEHVLNKSDYRKDALLLPSTAAIVKAVTDDAGAIGYGGIAYAEHAPVKTINIKATPDAKAVPPTTETVVNGSYPISRPLFLITNGVPAGEIKALIDYCLGPDGQKVVTETGYIPTPKTAS